MEGGKGHGTARGLIKSKREVPKGQKCAYLNRLLQYLHGSVLGFNGRPSALCSVIPKFEGASMDCIASMF